MLMLEQIRIAHVYLNLVESQSPADDAGVRNLRRAERILATVNRLLAEGDFDRQREQEVVAERDRLQERLSALVIRAG